MKQTTRIICITLCVLLIALSAAGVIWALYNKFASNKAYADYEDLAGTDTLVNFNQIYNFDNIAANSSNNNLSYVRTNNNFVISGNSTSTTWFGNWQVNASIGHKYYFYIYTSNANCGLLIENQNVNIFIGTSPLIYTNNSYNFFGTYIRLEAGNYNNAVIKFYAIDLTQMFGSGNEPNLEQAKEYFTADYYSYNTGTAIPYSKDYLQGYQDGANDIYESMTITYNAYTIGSTSTTYANNTIERGTFAFDNQYGAYKFSGVISVNLTANVERGTNFDIDFSLMIPDLQGENNPSYAESTYYLHFAYVDENNVLNDIVSIKAHYIGSLTNQYTASFVLPITTSTLYIYVDYNTIGDNFGPTEIITGTSSITFKSTDMGLLMNNSYQRGYNAAAATYYYGTDNYNAIYNLGYQNGLATQNATLGAMDYVGAAFSGIGSILAIELLPGVPFSLFILLPLMFGLIAFVVKLSKGGD